MVNQMLKGKNVIKLFCIFLFISCSASKVNNKKLNSWYEIKKIKSKNNETKIILNSYDYENKEERIAATIVINNVLLNSETIRVWPGKHSLEVICYSKLPIKINNLRVEKGDSIVINAYLKDSNYPIEDFN